MSKTKTSTKMTDDDFWAIVAKVDWPGLCLKETRNSEDKDPYGFDSCETGKEILMKLLPTVQDSEEFRSIHSNKFEELVKTITELEVRGVNLELGDDSTNDLINHIIGCGKEEYELTLKEPKRIWHRVHSGRFVESFGYCFPYEDDYMPIETQIKQAEDGLRYWVEQKFYRKTEAWLEDEIGRRAVEVAKLQAKQLGQASSRSILEKLATQAKNEHTLLALEKINKDLKTKKTEIEKTLDEVREELKVVKNWLETNKA